MPINPLQLPPALREPQVDWSRLDMIGDAIVQGRQNARVAEILGGGPVDQGAQPPAAQSQPMPAMPNGQLPRGLRNNNPGNIEDGPLARSLPGYAGSDGRFAKFDSPDNGLNAMDALLTSYGRRGLKTVRDVISRWAPASDGNNVENYARFAGGGNPDAPVDLSNVQQRRQLAVRMAQFENGMAPPAAQQPAAAAAGMPPDVSRKIQALMAIGSPQALRAAQFLKDHYEREIDRGFRREEADRAQRNTDRSFGLQQQQFDLQRRQVQEGRIPPGYRPGPNGLEAIPGGPADPAVIERTADVKAKPRQFSMSDITKLEEDSKKFGQVNSFATTFEPRFAGYRVPMAGSAAMAAGRYLPEGVVGKDTADAANWWQGYQSYKNVVRNDLFGSALTATEQREFEKADINPGMDPKIIEKNLARQQEIVRNGLKRKANALIEAGYEPRVISAAYGVDLKELGVDAQPRRGGAAPPAPAGAVPWQQYFGNR